MTDRTSSSKPSDALIVIGLFIFFLFFFFFFFWGGGGSADGYKSIKNYLACIQNYVCRNYFWSEIQPSVCGQRRLWRDWAGAFIRLFDLILYVPVNNFQSCRDGSSWVEPALSRARGWADA